MLTVPPFILQRVPSLFQSSSIFFHKRKRYTQYKNGKRIRRKEMGNGLRKEKGMDIQNIEWGNRRKSIEGEKGGRGDKERKE